MKKLLLGAAWLGIVTAGLLLKISTQAPTAQAGVNVTGYFTGASISANDGELAEPSGSCGSHPANAPGYEDGKCSDLSGIANVSGTTNKMNLLLFDLAADVNGANGHSQAAGAAFIIEAALYGVAKPGNINSVQAGINDAQANFTKFSNIVKQYNAAGQLSFMSFQNGHNSAKDDSSLDSGFYLPPGDPVYTAVFTDSGGGVVYSIRLNCGNIDGVLGGLTPLPPSVTLTINDLDSGASKTRTSTNFPPSTPAPTITVDQDDNLSFTWSSANVTNCAKYNDWPKDDGSSGGGGVPLPGTSGTGNRDNRDTNTTTTKNIYIDCSGAGGHIATEIDIIVNTPGGGVTTDQITLKDNTTNISVTAHQNQTRSLVATVGDSLTITNYKSANATACAASGSGSAPWPTTGVTKNASVAGPNLNAADTASPVGAPGSLIAFDCTDNAVPSANHYTAKINFTVVSPAYHPFVRFFRGDIFSCGAIAGCTGSQDQPVGSLGAPASNYATEVIIASAVGTSNFCSVRGYNFGAQGAASDPSCPSGPYVPAFNPFSSFYANALAVAAKAPGCDSPYATSKPTAYLHGTLGAGPLNLGANVNTQTLGSNPGVCGASGVIYTTSTTPGGNFTISASGATATLAQGTATIYVNGDVNISKDITNAFTGTYAAPGNIPSLAVIANGDIDIAPGVQNLDLALFATGTIRDCATTTTDSYGSATCNNFLTIRGMMIANNFELARNFWNVGANAAEKIFLSAHVLAFPPPGFTDVSTNDFTQAKTLFQENNGRF